MVDKVGVRTPPVLLWAFLVLSIAASTVAGGEAIAALV